MTALSTSDPGETVTQNPTVQIAVDDGPQIGTIKPIGPLKTFLIDPFKLLEMILNTLIIFHESLSPTKMHDFDRLSIMLFPRSL